MFPSSCQPCIGFNLELFSPFHLLLLASRSPLFSDSTLLFLPVHDTRYCPYSPGGESQEEDQLDIFPRVRRLSCVWFFNLYYVTYLLSNSYPLFSFSIQLVTAIPSPHSPIPTPAKHARTSLQPSSDWNLHDTIGSVSQSVSQSVHRAVFVLFIWMEPRQPRQSLDQFGTATTTTSHLLPTSRQDRPNPDRTALFRRFCLP